MAKAKDDMSAGRPDTELPRWAERLLDRLVPARNRDIVLGDFAEVFQYIAASEGPATALRWYGVQVLKSLPAFLMDGLHFGSMMLGNYLKMAFRNLRKRAFFSALNIGGLAIGMAACLLIFQYVAFEYSYDAFHEEGDRLYRIVQTRMQNGEAQLSGALSWSALGPAIEERIPEVETVVRVHPNYGKATIATTEEAASQKAFREDGLYYVDPAFLETFSFPLEQGGPATALAEPGTMVLTKAVAQRFFDEENPVGKTLRVSGWVDGTYRITGVLKEIPSNSHLQFDYLLPLADLLEKSNQYKDNDGWSWTNFAIYLQMLPTADPEAVAGKVEAVIIEHKKDNFAERNVTMEVALQPLMGIHLGEGFDEDIANVQSRRTVYFFTIVALFILILAWVNYINLTTARAVERAREVGVRKAAGARKMQVVSQFLVEAGLLNGVALVLALGLAIYGLPIINDLADVHLTVSIWKNPWFWVGVAAVFGIGTVLASLYPAFVLSAFQPATVLKGTLGMASRKRLRQGLVVFQFVASIALLTGTYVVYEQVGYMRNLDTGFAIDEVLIVRGPSFLPADTDYGEMRKVFKNELAQLPGVQQVATSTNVPGSGFNLNTTFQRESAPASEGENMSMNWINSDFIDTYGLNLAAGRNFSEEFQTDEEEAVIVNETAVRTLGYETNAEAIGEPIFISRDNRFIIVGVLEDFHWMSAKQEPGNILLGFTPGGGYYSLRLTTDDLAASLNAVQATYDRVFPGNPFDYYFANSFFNEQYRADQRFGTLFGAFALLALIVACLGLIGLASYTVAQRTKEIGIRKVLGASAPRIAGYVLLDFAKLVALALILTAPLVYISAGEWLDGFAARIDLGVWIIVLPGLAVLLVAVLTVSYHALRISRINPARALRYE